MSKVTVALAQRPRWQALAFNCYRSGLMMFEDAAGSGKRAPIVISSLVVSPCRVVVIRRVQFSSTIQVQQLALLKKIQRHASVKIKTRLTVGRKC